MAFEFLTTLFSKSANSGNADIELRKNIANLLNVSPEALENFEKSYANYSINVTNKPFFELNAKDIIQKNEGITPDVADAADVSQLIDQIVNELLDKTNIWSYDGIRGKTVVNERPNNSGKIVTSDEIKKLPENIRPQLTGNLMKVDINTPSYIELINLYMQLMDNNNSNSQRRTAYNMFRQGLDILDYDPIMYQIIGTNPNSMGYWLPKLVEAIKLQDFFKIPKTKIMKVPMTVLQLTRLDYASLTRTTLDIIDKFCYEAFELDKNKDYFIKTGTYSSKFDFRNTHVVGAKEVMELGEYLLFIHHQANMMASPLNNKVIYGVSTTNEWVVREFIRDKEDCSCIYHGLPLHTEYRVFVDFDSDTVIGASPYWEPETMKKRFNNSDDSNNPDNIHDGIIYMSQEEKLMKKYNSNINSVVEKVKAFIPDVDLSGQYSIDIMQNGDDFWIIDMALAENSAFYNCVPRELRNPSPEKWIPEDLVV